MAASARVSAGVKAVMSHLLLLLGRDAVGQTTRSRAVRRAGWREGSLMTSKLSRDGLTAVRAVAERYVADDKVPGLAALVARGDEVQVEALGQLSVGGPPVTRNSLFRIASTTKPIT